LKEKSIFLACKRSFGFLTPDECIVQFSAEEFQKAHLKILPLQVLIEFEFSKVSFDFEPSSIFFPFKT
jgi:hypothetical protein